MSYSMFVTECPNLTVLTATAKVMSRENFLLDLNTGNLYSISATGAPKLVSTGSYSLPNASSGTRGGVLSIPTANFPARTDNSGGVSGGNTIAVVTDVASAANAIATLQAEIAQLRAVMVTAGMIV